VLKCDSIMTCANVKRNGNKRLPWQRQQRDTAEEWQSNGQEKCHCKVKAEPRFSVIFNKDVSYDTFLVYVSASAFETPHSTACTSGFGKLNEIQCLCVLHAENAESWWMLKHSQLQRLARPLQVSEHS
jgi:hypothetical protein